MKLVARTSNASVLLLIVAAGCSPAFAQPGDPKAAQPAATPQPQSPQQSAGVVTADRFREIWAGKNKEIFEPAFLARELREEPSWKPTEVVAAKLEAAKGDIDELIKVIDGPPADWQVNTKDEGFDAKVPHWPQLTATMRVLFADSRRLQARAGEGDADAAVKRVLAITKLARHFQTEKLVGAVRTARQLAATGLLEAKRLADAGRLTPAQKSRLLEAAMSFDSSDPCDIRGALLNETHITIDWTKKICVGDEAPNIFIAKFARNAKNDEIARSGVRLMDQATLHRQIESVLPCYREAIDNWDSDYALQTIKAIEQQRQNGDYGGPAVILNADLQHYRASTYRFVALIGDVIRSLGGTPKTTLPAR
ncbi:MAG: hypothetical protein AB7G11_13450 [Phycisphaerales bacterium]